MGVLCSAGCRSSCLTAWCPSASALATLPSPSSCGSDGLIPPSIPSFTRLTRTSGRRSPRFWVAIKFSPAPQWRLWISVTSWCLIITTRRFRRKRNRWPFRCRTLGRSRISRSIRTRLPRTCPGITKHTLTQHRTVWVRRGDFPGHYHAIHLYGTRGVRGNPRSNHYWMTPGGMGGNRGFYLIKWRRNELFYYSTPNKFNATYQNFKTFLVTKSIAFSPTRKTFGVRW